ncbi:MAG: hypothetical protein KME16_10510 [Scytolyngbya sp. HA4215-MV1]|jgi:hypothetical protein|nr:hypothetical protein [Scytolyngbya sp. HA4215-MV1]
MVKRLAVADWQLAIKPAIRSFQLTARLTALLNNSMKVMLNDLKLRSQSACFSATLV